MIKVYNTLSEEKENLPKPKRGPVNLFVCGPTVYDYSHIGHARTYVAFDAIVSYLRSQNVSVFYLQNITDIDDKIIERAREQGKEPKVVAKEFEKAYYQDMKALGVDSVDKYARATDHIKEIVKQIKTLIKKGHAYEIPGDGWYFDLSTFPDYGKLSHRTALQANDSVSRIDTSDKKRNTGDFALWKFSPPSGGQGEPSWKTELGAGRPGWHIEDTAISEKFFGPQYDLHGGAVDLKFPHHEAEIAQQESASGKKPFVKIWMHTGFLLINGEKMSKSLGNFITIRDFLAKSKPEVLRLIVLSHHYRSPIDFSENLILQHEASLERLEHFVRQLDHIKKTGTASREIKSALKKFDSEFQRAMEDDFKTPDALAAIFNLISRVEADIWDLNKKETAAVKKALADKLAIFKITLKTAKIPGKITKMAKKRELYRSNKQFTQADALRKEIEQLGFSIEDTPVGPLVLPSSK
jgi:cysteinyl-tRNA synthetase